MEKIRYIDYDELLSIYYKMIEKSGGGFPGIIHDGTIRATLEFVQNDLYYPTFVEKLTYLVFSFCCGHCFTDGNKRIAATLFIWFLNNNGILYAPDGRKRIADNTLVALTLMIAESRPEEKDVMVKVVVNLINKKN